jgi:bifunctional ADP-heptose synthase (sugar kinase/adenylyltransferase)
MKKATMNTILSLIATIDTPEADAVRAELTAELNKGAEVKAQNAELYDTAKAVVMAELGETPVTIGELYEAVEEQLPEGFTKGKLQYAVTRLWKDEIVRIEGKVNTYRKA